MAILCILALFAASPLDRAVAHIEAGRFAEAESALREILRGEPDNARAWKALGVVFASQSDYEFADEPFRNACRLNPREPDACYYLGRNLYALNRFEPSIDSLKKALPIDAMPARVHLGLAQSYEALGRVEFAEASFKLASQTSAKAAPDAQIAYGIFLFRQGRLEEAQAVGATVVANHPSNARARLQLGRVLYQREQWQAAVEQLEKTVRLDPSLAAAHLLLGKSYAQLGQPEPAQRHLATAERLGLH